jgi:hypothetical protein
VLAWFESLGMSAAEIDRVGKFDIGGYVGIPFSTLSLEDTVLIAKYLSLWLLWDDVQVESLEGAWRFDATSATVSEPTGEMSRFDAGWSWLLRTLGARRSHRWLRALCDEMTTWSRAAAEEGRTAARARQGLGRSDLQSQWDLRVVTIGMYPTFYLIEDSLDLELPPDFHASPAVERLKLLASIIVALGNEIFSFAKDHVEGRSM